LRRFHGWLARHRDAFVIMADDGYWGDWLKRHPKLFSRIIPNGIAEPAWGEISREERARYRRKIGVAETTRWVVTTVGRVVAERRPSMYLPILRKVIDTLGPDIHFIYAGGGPYENELRAEIAAHGLEGRVSITGLVRNPALPLSITDIYLTYNVGPVAGIATLEAAFKRLPIAALQVLEGYDGRSDWIKSASDPDAVAADIVALLQSPEARATRAAQQYAHARENLRVEVMAQSYEEVYLRAIAEAG
jgi:glycosyltransferase involved in cell wall biosynthesis